MKTLTTHRTTRTRRPVGRDGTSPTTERIVQTLQQFTAWCQQHPEQRNRLLTRTVQAIWDVSAVALLAWGFLRVDTGYSVTGLAWVAAQAATVAFVGATGLLFLTHAVSWRRWLYGSLVALLIVAVVISIPSLVDQSHHLDHLNWWRAARVPIPAGLGDASNAAGLLAWAWMCRPRREHTAPAQAATPTGEVVR